MLKKVVIGAYVIATITVVLMAAWTQTIGNTALAETGESATEDLEWVGGVPMNGGITITSHSTMLESRPSWVFYNISLQIPSESPMNLRVDEIRFVFTSSDYAYRPEDEIVTVGGVYSYYGILEVVNATSVIIRGNLQITPEMPEGKADGFLGCIIDFHYWEYGLSSPSNNSWGEVGVIQMRQFTIISAYLAQEPWFFAMEASLLVWVVLIIYFVYNKAKT